MGKGLTAKGLTAYICIGKWSGFHVRFTRLDCGVWLGWVSLSIVAMDIEQAMGLLLSVTKEKTK
jgi:hypothetical protein